MKTSTILLTVALAFKTIYSRAIVDNLIENKSQLNNQLNDTKVEDPFEIVKDDKFVYKFHCSEEKTVCDGFKNDLDFAFKTISNTFEIYQPITFEVFVDDVTLKYGLGETLAAVMDTNFVSLRASNNKNAAPYLYPQALVKQLKLDKEVQYKPNDFILVINNCNSLPQYKNNEIRSIMTHEIFHGLGFVSIATISKLTEGNEKAVNKNGEILFKENDQYTILPRIVPAYSKKVMQITDEREYMNEILNTPVNTFTPFSVFDKYIVSTKTGERVFKDIPFFYREANKRCLPKDGSTLLLRNASDKYLSDCYKKLTPKTQQIITNITKDNFFDIDTLGIKTVDGEVVTLQTMYGRYIPGSSVSHMNNPLYDEYYTRIKNYGKKSEEVKEMFDPIKKTFKLDYILKYYDENFILYFSDEDDFTVEQMLEKLPINQKHPLIGEGIVKIMKTIGWTGKGMKRNTKLHFVDETLNFPDSKGYEYLYKRKYEISNKNKTASNKTTLKQTNQPVSKQPNSNQSGIEQPVSKQPVSNQQVSKQPVSNQQVSKQPVSNQQVSKQPVSNQQVSKQPVSNQQVSEQSSSNVDESSNQAIDVSYMDVPGEINDEDVSNVPFEENDEDLQILSRRSLLHFH